MIKSENGTVTIDGSVPGIQTDLAGIIETVIVAFEKEYGDKKEAEEQVREAIRLGFMTDEEIKKECEKRIKEAGELFGEIFGGKV